MPVALADLLIERSGAAAADVVDLGAGTGLSCLMWRGRARRITAIEPRASYRAVMERRFAMERERGEFVVVDATAEVTGLPDACADIVTACGSLHWFDLDVALAEVARVLRPGGVFAVCNAASTPLLGDWEADLALREVVRRIKGLADVYGPGHAPTGSIVTTEGKSRALAETRLFRDIRSFMVHSVEEGSPQRVVELAGTLGGYRLLKQGASEEEFGLPRLRRAAEQLGDRHRWWWSISVNLALR